MTKHQYHSRRRSIGLRLILAVFSLFSLISMATAKTQTLDSIAAIVNQHVITTHQLTQQMAIARSGLLNAHLPVPSKTVLRQQVLQHMIDTELQLQMADTLGLSVSKEDVTHAIDQIAKQNHLSTDALLQKLNAQGIDKTHYRQQIHKQLQLRQVQRQAIGHELTISPADIKAALNTLHQGEQHLTQYHLQRIFIRLPDTPSPKDVQQAEKEVAQLQRELKQGANFAKLAIAHSDGDKAMQGGDWGWQSTGAIPTVFVKSIKGLKPGQDAKPIRTGNGFHLIRLLGTRQRLAAHQVPETHVAHILIRATQGLSDQHAKQELLRLRQDISKGQSFAQLAKAYSQDPNSAKHGGDLGWVQGGMLTPNFAHAMDKLKIGQISEPVHSAFGWHLIKVLGRREVPESAHAQEARARALVFNRKFSHALQNWLRQLRAQAYIKIITPHNAN